jgi:putative oxidoreductase
VKPIQALARPLLASVFVVGGIETFRNPAPRAKMAAPVLDTVKEFAPAPLDDPVTIVRANAALQVAAGCTLALGIAPRLSALALASSLIPTTIGGHRFWEIEDPAQRGQQLTHFLKNAAILGGLAMTVAAG